VEILAQKQKWLLIKPKMGDYIQVTVILLLEDICGWCRNLVWTTLGLF
jgi:hypothetical protein